MRAWRRVELGYVAAALGILAFLLAVAYAPVGDIQPLPPPATAAIIDQVPDGQPGGEYLDVLEQRVHDLEQRVAELEHGVTLEGVRRAGR